MIRFSSYLLDSANFCLWKVNPVGERELIGLPPKTFDVLRHLAESGGRLVSHNELLDALWSRGAVQPDVLKGHILALRTALGDDAQQPRFIETHRGRGYRFIAAIEQEDEVLDSDAASLDEFVGRNVELAALHKAFQAAQSGQRRMVFISGEPGMGKTTLVDRFLGQVKVGAVRVAIGRSVESHGTSEPYFPFFEALADMIKSSAQAEVVNALLSTAPSWALQIPGLLPAERLHALQRQVGNAPRNRLMGEFCDFIEALTSQSVLVLVLEDLHWADFSSIDLLKSMASRRLIAKLLIVGTYRKEIANYRQHPVGELVQNLIPYEVCTELCLAPLSPGDIGGLIAAEEPGQQAEFADFLSRRTGGNPLFLALILEQLVQRRMVERLGAACRPLLPVSEMTFETPVTLGNIIGLQLRQLSMNQLLLLECASIFGDGFAAATVAAVAGQAEHAVEQELETLARSSMFIATGGIEYPEEGLPFSRYFFNHALYQQAFYEHQAPTQRARRHLASAEALLAGASEPVAIAAELARHFAVAGAWPRALEQLTLLLVLAKRRFARRDALTVVERAESIIQRYRDTQRARLALFWSEEKAEIHAANHDLAARAAYEACVEQAAALGLVENRVRALLGLATVHSWLDVRTCLTILETARVISAMQSDAARSVRTRISCHVWSIWVGGWNREAANACAQLISGVQNSSDQAAAAWTMVEYSMLCLLSSRYREAQDIIVRNFHVLQNLPAGQADHGVARAGWMVSLGIPWLDMLSGRLGSALERLESNITMLEKNASPSAGNMLRLLRAQLYVHALDFESALEECEGVMRSIHERKHAPGVASVASLPGERRTCEITLGLAHMGVGNASTAIKQLLALDQEIASQTISFDWYRLLFLEWGLVRAYCRQGDVVNATTWSERLLARSLRTDEQCWQALAWEMAAHVAMLANQPAIALEAIKRAVHIVESAHLPLAAWRVYQAAASIRAAAGDADLASRYAVSAGLVLNDLAESLPLQHNLRKSLGTAQFTSA